MKTRPRYPQPRGNVHTSLAARRKEREAERKQQAELDKARVFEALAEVEEAVKQLTNLRPSDSEASK